MRTNLVLYCNDSVTRKMMNDNDDDNEGENDNYKGYIDDDKQ